MFLKNILKFKSTGDKMMAKNEKVHPDKLSHADKILVSFYKTSKGTTERVPFENIVLQAWKDFQSDFSLPNHPEHPDSYVIAKRIYSDLITNRLIVSLKNKTYRLSDKGLQEAKKIVDSTSSKRKDNNNPEIQLNREERQFMDNAIKSKTLSIWKKGKKNELIDYDVRVFFQFSTGTPYKERNRKVETAKDALNKATRLNLPESNEISELFDFLIKNFPQLFQEK
jgi:hypothetical protein